MTCNCDPPPPSLKADFASLIVHISEPKSHFLSINSLINIAVEMEDIFFSRTVVPGYDHIVFNTFGPGILHPRRAPPHHHDIFNAMRDHGRFSIVKVKGGMTSVRGPPKGTIPSTTILERATRPVLLTGGGFYSCHEYWFRFPNGGGPMWNRLERAPVGETSNGPEFIPFNKNLASMEYKFEGDDGTFVSLMPSLKEPLQIITPDGEPLETYTEDEQPFTNIFTYDCRASGQQIHNVVKEGMEAMDLALHEEIQRLSNGLPRKLPLISEIEGALKYPKKMIVDVFLPPTQDDLENDHVEKVVASVLVPNETSKNPERPELVRIPKTYVTKRYYPTGDENSLVQNAFEIIEEKEELQQGLFRVSFFQEMPHHDYVRPPTTLEPGSPGHFNEPNQRAAIGKTPDGTVLVFNYTCDRDNGLTMKQWKTLTMTYCLSNGIKLEDMTYLANTDGSYSACQILLTPSDGVMILSSGANEGQFPPKDLKALGRSSPNYILVFSPEYGAEEMSEFVDPRFENYTPDFTNKGKGGWPDYLDIDPATLFTDVETKFPDFTADECARQLKELLERSDVKHATEDLIATARKHAITAVRARMLHIISIIQIPDPENVAEVERNKLEARKERNKRTAIFRQNATP